VKRLSRRIQQIARDARNGGRLVLGDWSNERVQIHPELWTTLLKANGTPEKATSLAKR